MSMKKRMFTSQLQMKIDGEKARRSIERIREQFKAPEVQENRMIRCYVHRRCLDAKLQ